MNYVRYKKNEPLYMYAQDFVRILLQQFYRATEKIKTFHEESCEERDHQMI